MPILTQLSLNIGTEQNPNMVLHDINDKRISTTAVTTATHLLTCNSGVTSIAPITAANLASVLGAPIKVTRGQSKALKVTFKGDNRSCIFESFWTGGPTITGRAIIFIEDDKVYFLGGDYGRVSYQFYNNELYLGSVGSSPGYFMVSSSEYQKVTFTEVNPPTGGTWLSSEKIQSVPIS